MMTTHNNSGLSTEATMTLSQSMDSVNTTPEEEVRTLFVSGLPMDAKPRELYLLFRAYKGYEGSLLKVTNKNGKNTSGYGPSPGLPYGHPPDPYMPPYPTSEYLMESTERRWQERQRTGKPVGFVTFSSRVAAEAAKQDLQGVRFDPDLPQTLRLEFAKSNTKVTKPKQQSPQPAATHPTLVHPLTGQELGAAFFPGAPEAWATHPLTAAYAELNPAGALHHPTLIQHPALAQVHAPLTVAHPGAMTAHATVPHPHMAASPMLGSPIGNSTTTTASTMQNAPCSTLFVANLGPFCSEQEMKDLFGSFPGFSRLRMHNKGGSPVAFVEYQDVRYAMEALTRLQGFVLLSSERGGIRIEYAKNKMGEPTGRKDDNPSGPSPVPPQPTFQ